LADGLAAKLADPLWLLGRQLVLGEFAATDSGSPVGSRLWAQLSALTKFRAGRTTGPGVDLSVPTGPLEVLVEAEGEPLPRPLQPPAGSEPDAPARPLASAQAGLQLVRMLKAASGSNGVTAYMAKLVGSYPFPPRPTSVGPEGNATDPLLQAYASRVPDGQTLYDDFSVMRTNGGHFPADADPGPDLAATISPIALAWLDWFDATASAPLGRQVADEVTWSPRRLEYEASVASPGPRAETVLTAGEHVGGSLDWFDFDLVSSSIIPAADASLGATPPSSDPLGLANLPVHAHYRGMPNARFFAFEDGAVNFGAITAPVESPTTAVVIEFALTYGNDFYVVPVPLAIGSVCRIERLVVANTFGERILIRPVAELEPTGPFRLFEHAVAQPDDLAPTVTARDPLLILFPTLDHIIEGPLIEEVDYLRDELAEIVWAVEAIALGPDGWPVDRSALARAAVVPDKPVIPAAGSTASFSFVERTDVEANWFAFTLPDPNDQTDQTIMPFTPVPPADGTGAAPQPWGVVLNEQIPASVGLPQEEVSRSGVQVIRRWRYARWCDGRTLAWVGRTVEPGRGEGTSGLAFDVARANDGTQQGGAT